MVEADMARRARKVHVQQSLFRNGGRRRGAGRKPKGLRAGSDHQTRPDFRGSHGLHVTIRVVPEVGNLRREAVYRAVRAASEVAAARGRMRIVQISIQRTHLHLLIEAAHKGALAAGMQGLQVSIARRINTLLGDGPRRRRGRVFSDRYHLVVIRSPKQARHVLVYLMNNWRRHGEHREGAARAWLLDRFSSACSFPDWQELDGRACGWQLPPGYVPLVMQPPRTWLLRHGWKLHGPISVHTVPGPADRAAARARERDAHMRRS
jgi:REP element-mobilizing transposase RayT